MQDGLRVVRLYWHYEQRGRVVVQGLHWLEEG